VKKLNVAHNSGTRIKPDTSKQTATVQELNADVTKQSEPAVEADVTDESQLVIEHMPLVRAIAQQIRTRLPRHIATNDLVQAGTIGLIYASRRFNRARGVSFASYARWRIRGAILDGLRELDWASRGLRRNSRLVEGAELRLAQSMNRAPSPSEIANAIGWTTTKLQRLMREVDGSHPRDLDAESAPAELSPVQQSTEGPYRSTLRHEIQRLLAQAIANLPEQQQQVLALRYYEEATNQEVSSLLRVTESRVSQIHTAALVTLRKRLVRHLAGTEGELQRPPFATGELTTRHCANPEQNASSSGLERGTHEV
jgi:RNA polymerase sigma factor FliA